MDWRIAFPLVALACDPSITVESGNALQVSWDEVYFTHLPALLVITVDDGADVDAAAARASMTRDGLLSSFHLLLTQRTPAPSDPASGFTWDARVVIVHPRSGTFVTPLDDPRLRISATATTAELDGTADSVLAHVEEAVMRRDAPYPLIARTRDVVSLLLRERDARDAHEAAVAQSMPAFRTVTVTLITSRDDDGETASLPPDTERQTAWYAIYAPCGNSSEPDVPRLQAWQKSLQHAGILSFASCDFVYVFFDGGADYSCGLSANDVARDEDGNAECSITFDSRVTSCDPARGWDDPIGRDGVRRPWFDEVDGVTTRRCEIVQLAGDARTSCEQSLACEGCTPGFCLKTLEGSDCPSLARFIGGSLYYDEVSQPRVHFTCNLR